MQQEGAEQQILINKKHRQSIILAALPQEVRLEEEFEIEAIHIHVNIRYLQWKIHNKAGLACEPSQAKSKPDTKSSKNSFTAFPMLACQMYCALHCMCLKCHSSKIPVLYMGNFLQTGAYCGLLWRAPAYSHDCMRNIKSLQPSILGNMKCIK